MNILSSGKTDIGMKRKSNQDSICLLPENSFFAVADGMGGHNGGDIASQTSTKLFPEFFKNHGANLDVPQLLIQSIKHINNSLFELGAKNQELQGMGTTISAIMFSENFVHFANIGDSRIYMVHKQKLYQMTRDHSLVQEKLNLGIYDREGAKRDPQKNVLVRTVGFEQEVEIDLFQYRRNPFDLFLICSDGLHGKVSDHDILKIINHHIPEPSKVTKEQLDGLTLDLIKQANTNGGQDNISVVLAVATE